MSRIRFNTSFLLKATAVCAVGCLPVALSPVEGAFVSAIAVPLGIAWLVCTKVIAHGEYQVRFEKISESLTRVWADGGRQGQVVTHGRVLGLTLIAAIPLLLLAKSWTGVKLPVEAVWFLAVVAGVGLAGAILSADRIVDRRRDLVLTQVYAFGRYKLLQLCWRVQDGDYLAVHVHDRRSDDGKPEFQYAHILYVCRGRRRRMIVSAEFEQNKEVSGMNTVGERLAKQLGVPYRGYTWSRRFWWPGL